MEALLEMGVPAAVASDVNFTSERLPRGHPADAPRARAAVRRARSAGGASWVRPYRYQWNPAVT